MLPEGEDQLLECYSTSSTEWVFLFTKYSVQEMVQVEEIPNIRMGEYSRNIFIERATRDNQGEYECTGINDKGERFFALATVKVRGKSHRKLENITVYKWISTYVH